MRQFAIFPALAILAFAQEPRMFNPRNLPTCTMTGRVTTMTGEPLAGAKVTVGYPVSPEQSASAITEADGLTQ